MRHAFWPRKYCASASDSPAAGGHAFEYYDWEQRQAMIPMSRVLSCCKPGMGLPVALIVAGGVCLRIWGIRGESYGIDEISTVANLPAPTYDLFLKGFAFWGTPPMPAYFPPVYFLYHSIYPSAFLVRLLSLGIDPLTIIVLYLLARRLAGEAPALIAAGCMALSPFCAYYAQEARMYAFLPFYATLSMYTMASGLDQGRSRRWWGVHLAANTLLVFTNFLAGTVILAEGVYLLLFHHRRIRWLAAWGAFRLLLLIVLLAWMTTLNLEYISNFAQCLGPITPLQVWMILMLLAGGLAAKQDLHMDIRMPALLDIVVFLFIYGLVLGFLWRCFAQTRKDRRLSGMEAPCLMFLWLGLPITALYALSVMLQPCLTCRYVLMSAPALCILIGMALCDIGATRPRFVLTAVTLALYGIQAAVFLSGPHRPDYRSAGAYITSQRRPDDKILIIGDYNRMAMEFNAGIPMKEFTFTNAEDRPALTAAALLKENPRIWVFACLWAPSGNEGTGFAEFLSTGSLRYTVREFPGWPSVRVYLIEHLPKSENGP